METGAPAGTRRRFALLCAATLLHFTAMGLLLAALPLYLTRELDASRSVVGLAVGSFSFSAVAFRPVVGRRLDSAGRRVILAASPLLLALATVSLLAANSVAVVIVLRLLHGLSGAGYYTAAATVATDLSPDDRRAAFLSRFSLFLYAGFAVGPALAEAIISSAGFRATWLFGAAAATTAACIALAVGETRRPRDEAHVAPRGFVHPAAVGPGLVLLLAAVGYTAISVFSPLYATYAGLGSSGPLYVAFAVTVIAVRLTGGGLADRHGRVAVALPGILVGAAGLALLAATRHPLPAVAGVAAFGAGFALIFPALMALAADRAPEVERGAVLGSFTAFFDVGAALGAFAVGALADTWGYAAGFGVPAGLCTVGAAALARMRAGDHRGGRPLDQPLPGPAGG